MVTQKVKQTKMGSGIPKGSEDRTVSHHSKLATWRIKADQFRSKINGKCTIGPPSWPEHGQVPTPQQRHWTPEYGNLYLSLECPGVCSSAGRRKHIQMFSKE